MNDILPDAVRRECAMLVDTLDEVAPARHPEVVDCVVGDMLCRVRVLSDAQWEAIPPGGRPSPAEYFPGLGWVVADAHRTR